MGVRAIAISTLVCVGLVVASAAFTDLTLERAAVLAPVLVISVGAIAFLIILWGKVAYESWRDRGGER